MIRFGKHCFLALAGLLVLFAAMPEVLASHATTMAHAVGAPSPFAQRGKPHEDGRRRWKSMGAKKRDHMRARFERWHGMEPERRDQRADRAERLRSLMKEVYAGLDEPVKARINALPEDERTRYLASLAIEEARTRSARAKVLLGEEGQGKRPGGPGKDRKGEFKKFLVDARQAMVRGAQEKGIPAGISQADWDRVLGLEEREFGRELRHLVHRHPELRKWLPRPPHRPKSNPRTRLIRRAMHISPEEHMGLLQLPPDQREARKNEIRKERVLQAMQQSSDFTDQEKLAVQGLDPANVGKWLHKNVMSKGRHRRGPGGPPHSPGTRDGDPRGHGPPPGKRGDRSRTKTRGPKGSKPPRGPDSDGKAGRKPVGGGL